MTLEQPWLLIPGYPADLQLTSYVMLYHWFMVMKLQGLFTPVSPSKIWQPARVDKSTRAMKSRPNRKPPKIILKHILLLLFIAYCMTVEATAHRVREGRMEMHQLCILPLTFILVALLERTRQQYNMPTPELEQMDHAEPHPLLPIAFVPPENPCTECENIELFSLLSALQERVDKACKSWLLSQTAT